MAPAATLLEAANTTPQHLRPLWEADTLQTKVIAFWEALVPSFAEENPNDHPIINWISIISAFAPSILDFDENMASGSTPFAGGTISTFAQAVDYIYRICKFGYYYPLITTDQQDAILDAYNAQFT